MNIQRWLGWLRSHLLPATKHDLEEAVTRMALTQAELAQTLNDLSGKLTKIGTETAALLTRVTELTTALENANLTSPEVDAALEALTNKANEVDDLVADVVPEVPAGGGEAPAS